MFLTVVSCSKNHFNKVTWEGEIIDKEHDLNYLYWRDGVQYSTQQNDSIKVSMAGFSFENYIYILLYLFNEAERPITFKHKSNTITYQYKAETVVLEPVRPKNLDQDHFSFFNTMLVGAGSISRLFINLPVDMLIKSGNNGHDALSKIDKEYHDEDVRITKKIFIGNHTLFPNSHYAGFIVFEYNEDLPLNNDQFIINVILDNKEYTGTATFLK